MSGDSTTNAAVSAATPTSTGRALRVIPYLVLAGGLILTAGQGRSRAGVGETGQRPAEEIRAEFVVDFEAVDRSVQAEVGRIRELVQGITTFAAATDGSPEFSVDDYLARADVASRFEGLRTGASVGAEMATELLGPELTPQIVADLSQQPAGIVLTKYTVDDAAVAVVGFPVGTSADPGARAALVFDDSSFMAVALSTPHGSATLRPLGSALAAVPATPGNEVRVTQRDDGGIDAAATVAIFDSAYELVLASEQGLMPPPGSDTNTDLRFLALGVAVSILGFFGLRRLTGRAMAGRAAAAAQRELSGTDRRFRASFEQAPIGMAEIDSSGIIVEVNGALSRLLEADPSLIIGRELAAIVHEADRADHRQRLDDVLKGKVESTQSEHRYTTSTGREVWVHESVSLIDLDASGNRSLLVQCQDVTTQRRTAWDLMQKALHDELTSLPNRALFLNRLKNALLRADRKHEHVGVLFIDIDRFKVVNDSLGHEMGDLFLVEISKRLQSAVRAGDTLARFGGDEFVVLCDTVSGPSEAAAVAQRIHAVLAPAIILGETPTFASASIGIALSDSGDASAEALLRDADAAMYRAKEGGRNRSELFDTSMRSALVARLEIESQLRTALSNGEIVMHYQAIVDPHTHLATGYEALVRWNHPTKGLLGPGAFLPVAEEVGLIHLIDSFALQTACRAIADWSDRFPVARSLYVTTNWSARNLGRFVQEVEQILHETGINPRQLVIEVTEGFLLEDTEASLSTLQRLKALGVQIAIDDFGTGYSSLSYLTRLSVDFLKIDKSFIDKLPGDSASAAVVGAIADMAARLGIGLVAEGVETDAQLDILRTLGSPRLQGYRFAKPRPAADIEHQLSLRSAVQNPILLGGRPSVSVGAGLASGELEA